MQLCEATATAGLFWFASASAVILSDGTVQVRIRLAERRQFGISPGNDTYLLNTDLEMQKIPLTLPVQRRRLHES